MGAALATASITSADDADAGDTLRASCAHDNSPAAQPIVNRKPLAPRYVVWGEGTTDEMCLDIVQVTER